MTDYKRKLVSALGSIVFFSVAPLMIAGFVPWWISRWHPHAAITRMLPLQGFGACLVLFGVVILVESFARFAFEGLGTPAPVMPTRHLVVRGSYRFVRNPIYVAVVSVIFGQAVFFGDVRLLIYGAIMWIGFHIFVVLYEEPTLRESFGAEYATFCASVPRWIPRIQRGRSRYPPFDG